MMGFTFLSNMGISLNEGNLNASGLIAVGVALILLLAGGCLCYYRRHGRRLSFPPEESSLRLILDDLNIATWTFYPGSGRLVVSARIEYICGRSRQELMENPSLWLKLIHPYDSLRVREAHKTIMSGKKIMLEHRLLLFNGETRWIQNLAVPLKDKSGRIERLEGLIIDVSEQKQLEGNMQQLAFYDALTGLPNRSMFESYFARCQASSRYFSQKLALVFIDLDSFKAVNDDMGHDIGDLLLKAVALRLQNLLRGSDLLSRVGGDEFVAILTRVSHESLIVVTQRIFEAFAEPFVLNKHRLEIGASIGISIFPDDGEDLETLIRNADQAMYQAKRQGKNSFRFYNRNHIGD